MKVLLFALLAAISYAQTGCGCVKSWEFKGAQYSGCDKAAPKDKQPWCYVDGGAACPQAKESTVKAGSFWRYCQPDDTSSAMSTDGNGNTVTHMVVVTKAGTSSAVPAAAGAVHANLAKFSGSGNPNEPPAHADYGSSNAGSGAMAGDDGHDDFKPLHKTMSEGRLLRKLWAEMNQIESLIHAANVDLKKRLIKAFKVVRARMVEWEKMKDDTTKTREGDRLRAMWGAMGAIEDEIHEINIAMKKRLQGLIKALRQKMGIFDAAAARIDRMRRAQGKSVDVSPPSHGNVPLPAAGYGNEQGGYKGPLSSSSSGPCPPGETAIAGAEGSVSCSKTAETALSVPSWRRHLQSADSMAPLVRTVSEGAKLRALWAELGGIEKEIHETNLVLKARLLAAFKVIRARMANWEKEGNQDKRRTEGERLRAQWAELGHVEEQIHITNQDMKRRLRKVIRVIREKMVHFNKGADEAGMLKNQHNPNKPGRKGLMDSDSLE